MNLAPAYDKWLEETLTQGRGEGRAETQTEIALRLMKKSMSLDDISECTGLSIEVLQALQANNSVRQLG
jgi:predicted transposase YdaD